LPTVLPVTTSIPDNARTPIAKIPVEDLGMD
jgi:hypothetical protein